MNSRKILSNLRYVLKISKFTNRNNLRHYYAPQYKNLFFTRILSLSCRNYSDLSISKTEMAPIVADYGTWKSPITSEILTKGSIKLSNDLAVDGKGNVYWLELKSDEGGRGVICSKRPDHDCIVQWTPPNYNVRTRSNEYGGGAFFVGSDGVYFINFSDQRIYRQKKVNEEPEALTPDTSKLVSYADGQYVKQLNKFVSVREDHRGVETGKRNESENTIVIIDPETKEEIVLVSGADFYGAPVVSEDGKQLAWCQWNHPNMPWDTTEIWRADLNEKGTSLKEGTSLKIAGVQNNSVILPKWSPKNELYFIDDKTNWWNLYHYDNDKMEAVNIIPKTSEIGGPQWVFGLDGYCFGPSGKIYTTYDNELGQYDIETKEYKELKLKDLKPTISGVDMGGFAPANSIVCSPADSSVYIIAGGPKNSTSVVRIHPEDLTIDIVRDTLKINFDPEYISVAEAVAFPTSDNMTSYGYFYAPKNKDYIGTENQLPPLMVRVHGGPTAATNPNFNLKHQYLTSRGIAVLDVNYRGSTGYGRIYRDSLLRKWGVYDIDDVCNGALYLVKQNKVDGKRLSIDGGSAGGYTTLAALTFRDVFHAGISNYGVSDLTALTKDTHKFESRYLDSIIGPYPADEKVYYERSPINFIDRLNTPMAFFQGGDDKVVLPSQAKDMFEAVKKKGLITALVIFPDEQHGFRIDKNIQKAIDGELFFLSKVFGFEAADISVDMEIFNLK